jgi:hypothetical protein
MVTLVNRSLVYTQESVFILLLRCDVVVNYELAFLKVNTLIYKIQKSNFSNYSYNKFRNQTCSLAVNVFIVEFTRVMKIPCFLPGILADLTMAILALLMQH